MPSEKFRPVSEEPVYSSSLLRVYAARFEGPGGAHFTRDVVRHPGAVIVVPLDEASGEVVLVRQYRAPLDSELLEVPAGKRDVVGEPTEVTAARELEEEAGLQAGRMELIGHFYNSPGFSDEETWCYLARDLRQVPDGRQGIEEQHMTVERHLMSEVLAMVRRGDIVDAKTIVGLLLAQAALA